MKRILLYIILFIFVSTGCSDKILQTCLEEQDIEFKFEAQNESNCGDSTTIAALSDASFTVYHQNYQTGIYSILKDDLLADENGKASFFVPNSGCGISGVKIKANSDLYFLEQEYEFLCCDTTFAFMFERNLECEDSIDDNTVLLSCTVLDTAVNRVLTNHYGGCLVLGTSEANISNSRFLKIYSSDSVRVNTSSIFELEAPFYANMNVTPDAEGWITIGGENNIKEFVIGFLINTENEGLFDTSLTFETECLTSDKTGVVTIDLSSEICASECNCPFANEETILDVNLVEDETFSGQIIEYPANKLFSIDHNMLTDDCYMNVVNVARYPSGRAASVINDDDEANFDWVMDVNALTGMQFGVGEDFAIDLTFMPTNQGVLVDTFEISVNIVDKTGALIDDGCSFLVVVSGKTCVAPVPELIVKNFYNAALVSEGTVIDTLEYDSQITFSEDENLVQDLDAKLDNLCPAIEFNKDEIIYQIQYPSNLEEYCSAITVQINEKTLGSYNDSRYYTLNHEPGANLTLTEISPINLTVEFDAPETVTHLRSGHPDEYKIQYEIIAMNAIGDTIGIQNIELTSKVTRTIAEISEPQLMRSFSQISDLQSNPSYQAFKINELNPYYNYYGKVDNLNPEQGNINFNSDPVLPSTNHSFIFDVDEPKNKSKLQIPKLYLVKNDTNEFQKITSKPIAQYSSNNAFSEDVYNLIDKIFNNTEFITNTVPADTFQFVSDATTTSWYPSVSASELTQGNGVELVLGGVYIVWNPNGDKNENILINGDTYNNYCDVALLYIDGISDGAGTNHRTGYVGFYVAFPLGLVNQ